MDHYHPLGSTTTYAFSSNPSSTHSSPRSYPSDIEQQSYPHQQHQHHPMHSQSYPIPGSSAPFPPLPQQQQQQQQRRHRPHHSFTAPAPLQVSTSTSSSSIEHDPNESTARPGNAHKHAQFHSLPIPLPPSSNSSSAAAVAGSSGTGSGSESGATLPSSSSQEDATEGAGGVKDYTANTPGLSRGLSRPLTTTEQDRLAHLDKLKFFLATAPSRWDPASSNSSSTSSDGWAGVTSTNGGQGQGGGEPYNPPHPALNRFLLPTQEFVTCVLWKGLYHITGTDIVRALVFRFEAFGRPVRNMKKFEEGVFSDLRNLKPGIDATLEEPKSPFLDLLFKYQCIRTQKKQKVFYWFSVPHDRLFLDALERDLKREKMGLEPTTQITGEPALSFTYDPKRSLYEQFSKAQGVREGEGELEAAVRHATEEMEDADESEVSDGEVEESAPSAKHKRLSQVQGSDGIFPMVSLFEGSPTYKQRKKRSDKPSRDDERGRGRSVGSNGSGERYGSSVSVSRERVPPPKHSSMLDEFGPGSLAAQAEMEPSAADMFHKQARGELLPGTGIAMKPREHSVIGEVGVYYEGQPAPAQGQAGSYRERSQEQQQREYVPAGYHTTTFAHPLPRPVNQPQNKLAALGLTATSQYEAVSADGKVKAYVCPLFSCGRLFKRMEHLKRHLRTHTMERPFACQKCHKKFSRSDNLNQHLKTHERNPASGTVDVGEWDDMGDSDVGGTGESLQGSGGESEEDGMYGMSSGLGVFSQPPGSGMDVDMQLFDVNHAAAGGFNVSVSQNLNLFEVDVPGGVTDVQGDEEGLIMRSGGAGGADPIAMVGGHHQEYYQNSAASAASTNGQPPAAGMLFSSAPATGDFTDPQWATRGQHSPAFSTVSVPSPPPGQANLSHIRNPNRNSFHAPIRPAASSSSSSASSGYGDDYPVSASLSAPSHKQAFDHAALYPPNMIDPATAASAPGAGPIRRHRSMTPSVARNIEQARRPVTANSGEYAGVNGGSPGSSSSVSSSRGYHPYATYGPSSRAGSTHSSPAVYPVPLASEYPSQGRRSESRNSSYGGSALHEQMRQMMSMGGEQQQQPPTFVDNVNVFRTESPSSFHHQQTESPAPYNMDLPQYSSAEAGYAAGQQQQQTGAVFNKQGQYVPNVQPGQQYMNGYYTHPQHVAM